MNAAARVSAHDIEALLRERLAASEIEVIDEGHLHVGHAGAREGGHFRVRIVSDRFKGLGRVARHRLVYHSLGPLMTRGIHALAVDARAPGES